MKEIRKKFCAIGLSWLLIGCQSIEFKRPIINECTVFSDPENCICINSQGVQYTRSCWGDLVVSPQSQKRGERYLVELEKCIIECTTVDCSSMRNPCPEVLR